MHRLDDSSAIHSAPCYTRSVVALVVVIVAAEPLDHSKGKR